MDDLSKITSDRGAEIIIVDDGSSDDTAAVVRRAEAAMAGLFEDGLAEDGVIASSGQQRDQLWWLRETIPEANRKVGAHAADEKLWKVGCDLDNPPSPLPEKRRSRL